MANEAIFIKSGMRKMFLFSFNHRHDFIEKVWEDDPRLADHLRAKLNALVGEANFTSPDSILRFISQLDNGNMDKLFEYIIDTHPSW